MINFGLEFSLRDRNNWILDRITDVTNYKLKLGLSGLIKKYV